MLAASVSGIRPLEIEDQAERRQVFLQFVSDNYFEILGVQAFRGRFFSRQSAGAAREPIAVISHDYWRRRYTSDPLALGARIRLRSGHEFTIAGIAPPGFGGLELDVPADIWVPGEQVVAPNDPDRFNDRWMRIVGRLQPGAAIEQAQAEAGAVLGRPVVFDLAANG